MKSPKELIRDLVREQKITSTTQIMGIIKEMFFTFQRKYFNVKLKSSWVMRNTCGGMMVHKIIEMAQRSEN